MITESLISLGIIGILSILAKQFYFSGGVCKIKNRLDGRIVIITGANTGIGYETALELACRGARVIIACRDLKKAHASAKIINEKTFSDRVQMEKIDLASLESVREFAARMNEKLDRLDILINNAGVMQCPYWRTAENYEMHFGVNHLAHFLLTNLLLDLLKKTHSSRVITVSSVAHVYGKIKWDDLNCELEKNYSPLRCYNQSKLANVLFAFELAKRYKETGITSVSAHPGLVRTEIMRYAELGSKADIALGFISKVFYPFWYLISKSPWQGAQTTLHCALDDSIEKSNGLYFADCKPQKPSQRAHNEEDAAKLWDISCKLVDLH